MLKRSRRGSVSRLMAAVATVLVLVQVSAMALANAACCCQRMAMPADCPMRDGGAMPASHHHMDGMTMDAMPAAPQAPDANATCRFSCGARSAMSMFVTPGVLPLAPTAIAVPLAPVATSSSIALLPLDLARVPHAPPPRA